MGWAGAVEEGRPLSVRNARRHIAGHISSLLWLHSHSLAGRLGILGLGISEERVDAA